MPQGCSTCEWDVPAAVGLLPPTGLTGAGQCAWAKELRSDSLCGRALASGTHVVKWKLGAVGRGT